MKRLAIIALCLTMLMLSACSNSGSGNNSSENSPRDAVLNIAGARAYESSREGASLVFDTLTGLDENYRATPLIITE